MRRLSSPVKVALIGLVDTNPINNLTEVPEFPQSIMSSGSQNPPIPTPCTNHSFPLLYISTPKAFNPFAVLNTSSDSNRSDMIVFPTAKLPNMSAL